MVYVGIMDGGQLAVSLLEHGGKLVNTLITNWPTSKRAAFKPESLARRQAAAPTSYQSDIPRPSTEETIWELKRELVKQLNEAVGDLSRGLLIINKPCTCLEMKHQLEIEGAAEELIPMEPDNTVYTEIIQWFSENGYKVIPEAIASGKFKGEYPRMAAQFRSFRDRVGYRDERALKRLQEELSKPAENTPAPLTIPLSTAKERGEELTLEEAEEIAANEARQRVRAKWTAQKS